MVDFECKAKMITSTTPTKSPKLSSKLRISVPPPICFAGDLSPAASESDCLAYEHFVRLPELNKLWNSTDFPDWKNESILKPALQALEITFRFVSTAVSDPRPYVNRREWTRRLESLSTSQLEIIALLCEDEEDDAVTRGTAPIVDLKTSGGVLARDGSSVWRMPEDNNTTVVSRTSETSLLPRLATWRTSEDIAQKILYSIECQMRRCPYTLGLGEPNFGGKPSLDYDAVCKPHMLNNSTLKTPPLDLGNLENQTLYATHQILESWIFASQQLLNRIIERIDSEEFRKASSDCWILERTWRLLTEIQDLHLLVDPNDFLRLKSQLSIKATSESEAFCFQSRGLVELTKQSKELKHKVPGVLGVEVDPTGGPRIQEAAMELYRRERGGGVEKVHLLQAMQAVEAALKRFYYSYKQLVAVVMGSLEARGNRAFVTVDSGDSLAQIFLEPTYYPSLDAAKTFLAHEWTHHH